MLPTWFRQRQWILRSGPGRLRGQTLVGQNSCGLYWIVIIFCDVRHDEMKWNGRCFVRAAGQQAAGIQNHPAHVIFVAGVVFEHLVFLLCICLEAFSRWDVITFLHTVYSNRLLIGIALFISWTVLDASTPWVWLPASWMRVWFSIIICMSTGYFIWWMVG